MSFDRRQPLVAGALIAAGLLALVIATGVDAQTPPSVPTPAAAPTPGRGPELTPSPIAPTASPAASPEGTAGTATSTATATAPGGVVPRVIEGTTSAAVEGAEAGFLALQVLPATLPAERTSIEALFVQLLNADGTAGTRTTPLPVRLTSSDPLTALVPQFVTVPAGQSAVLVPIELTGETGTATFTAQATGLTSAQASVTTVALAAQVTGGALDLQIAPSFFVSDGTGPTWASISLLGTSGGVPVVTPIDLEVRLVSSAPDVIAVPRTVTIPAGAFHVLVEIEIKQRTGGAVVTALLQGFESATAGTSILRGEQRAVTLQAEVVPRIVLAGVDVGTQPLLVIRALDSTGAPVPFPCGPIELSSTAPAVIAVPEQAIPECGANQHAVVVEATSGGGVGAAQITIVAPGLESIIVVARAAGAGAAQLEAVLAPTAPMFGADSAGWLSLQIVTPEGSPGRAFTDVVVTLTAPPGVVPQSVTIPRGSSSVLVPLGPATSELTGAIVASSEGLGRAEVTFSSPLAIAQLAGQDRQVEATFNLGGVEIPVLWVLIFVAMATAGLVIVILISTRATADPRPLA